MSEPTRETDGMQEYLSLCVERELLIAQGVPEDDLLKPLAPDEAAG